MEETCRVSNQICASIGELLPTDHGNISAGRSSVPDLIPRPRHKLIKHHRQTSPLQHHALMSDPDSSKGRDDSFLGPDPVTADFAICRQTYSVPYTRRSLQQSHHLRSNSKLSTVSKRGAAQPGECWRQQNKSHGVGAAGHEVVEGVRRPRAD